MLQLEHPEITRCLRTGYPSWMQPRDDDEDEYEDEEAYEDEDDSFGSYDEDDRYDEARYEERFG